MSSKLGQQIHKGLLLKRENNKKSQIAPFTFLIHTRVLICYSLSTKFNRKKIFVFAIFYRDVIPFYRPASAFSGYFILVDGHLVMVRLVNLHSHFVSLQNLVDQHGIYLQEKLQDSYSKVQHKISIFVRFYSPLYHSKLAGFFVDHKRRQFKKCSHCS